MLIVDNLCLVFEPCENDLLKLGKLFVLIK